MTAWSSRQEYACHRHPRHSVAHGGDFSGSTRKVPHCDSRLCSATDWYRSRLRRVEVNATHKNGERVTCHDTRRHGGNRHAYTQGKLNVAGIGDEARCIQPSTAQSIT